MSRQGDRFVPAHAQRVRSTRGFTLIELMVSLLVIGIVSAIAIPNMSAAMSKSRHASTYKNIKVLEAGIQSWMIDRDGPPDSINVLTLAPLTPNYISTQQRRAILNSLDTGRLLYYYGQSGLYWDYDYIVGFRPKKDPTAVYCYLFPEGIWRYEDSDGWYQVM
jgi:type IV pilus assembly protein PilA